MGVYQCSAFLKFNFPLHLLKHFEKFTGSSVMSIWRYLNSPVCQKSLAVSKKEFLNKGNWGRKFYLNEGSTIPPAGIRDWIKRKKWAEDQHPSLSASWPDYKTSRSCCPAYPTVDVNPINPCSSCQDSWHSGEKWALPRPLNHGHTGNCSVEGVVTWAFWTSVGEILWPAVLAQHPRLLRASVSSPELWGYSCDRVRIRHCFLIWGPTVSQLGLLGAKGTGGSLVHPSLSFPTGRLSKTVFGEKVRTSRENTSVEPAYSNDIVSSILVCCSLGDTSGGMWALR